jgi:hypothetical protein
MRNTYKRERKAEDNRSIKRQLANQQKGINKEVL